MKKNENSLFVSKKWLDTEILFLSSVYISSWGEELPRL